MQKRDRVQKRKYIDNWNYNEAARHSRIMRKQRASLLTLRRCAHRLFYEWLAHCRTRNIVQSPRRARPLRIHLSRACVWMSNICTQAQAHNIYNNKSTNYMCIWLIYFHLYFILFLEVMVMMAKEYFKNLTMYKQIIKLLNYKI